MILFEALNFFLFVFVFFGLILNFISQEQYHSNKGFDSDVWKTNIFFVLNGTARFLHFH
jgi:hypothetical protein